MHDRMLSSAALTAALLRILDQSDSTHLAYHIVIKIIFMVYQALHIIVSKFVQVAQVRNEVLLFLYLEQYSCKCFTFGIIVIWNSYVPVQLLRKVSGSVFSISNGSNICIHRRCIAAQKVRGTTILFSWNDVSQTDITRVDVRIGQHRNTDKR